jgi:hypothetical protein
MPWEGPDGDPVALEDHSVFSRQADALQHQEDASDRALHIGGLAENDGGRDHD